MKGLRLEGKKNAVSVTWKIAPAKIPSKVVIPLWHKQNGDCPQILVKPGDYVKTGQPIVEPAGPDQVAVHATVSGEVAAIGKRPHPLGGEVEAVEIRPDIKQETVRDWTVEQEDWHELPFEDALKIFQHHGLVALDETVAPLHQKLSKNLALHPQTLVIDALDAEPYVTSHHALLMSHPMEILKAARFLARILETPKVVIVAGHGSVEAAELLKSKIYFLKWEDFEVRIHPDVYPSDVKVWAKSPGPSAVYNAATLFSVYEAAAKGKPLIERVVTVSGECIVEPGNLWVRIGTSFDEAIRSSRGLLREPRKVLMGGPMRGAAQAGLEVPVTPSTSAILALPKEIAGDEMAEPCIRCGRCVEVCPVDISPVMITLAAEADLFEMAEDYGVRYCIECGNCTYICPSKRPMADLIRYALQGEASSSLSSPIKAFGNDKEIKMQSALYAPST